MKIDAVISAYRNGAQDTRTAHFGAKAGKLLCNEETSRREPFRAVLDEVMRKDVTKNEQKA